MANSPNSGIRTDYVQLSGGERIVSVISNAATTYSPETGSQGCGDSSPVSRNKVYLTLQTDEMKRGGFDLVTLKI